MSGFGLPLNLDPHQVYDVPMQSMMLNAYDNLYRYQDDPPKIVPWLAESHTVSDDGLNWEFKLRPGVKFHDGSPLTAEDVVYSFRRVLALALAPAGAFLKILKPENVTAPDPLTVRFKLETSYAPFFAAIPSICIVNPRVIKANEKDGDWGKTWLASNDAGSGAYQIIPAGYRPLEYLDMEIYEGHFLGWKDNPKPVQQDRLPADQGDLDPPAGAAERLARLHRQQPAGRPGRRRSTSPRSPTSRRTWSCGPSSSA